MNKKTVVIAVAVLAVLVLAVYGWTHRDRQSDVLVLHGNVDLRQVDLPFKDSERIAAVLVEEGSVVKTGQVLARLDTSRLESRVRQAQAQVAAQSQLLRKLNNGARPEEIAQARAAVAAAEAEAANAKSNLDRLQSISDASKGRAISTTDLETATTQVRMSEASANNHREALALLLAGTRQEDVQQAKAQLDAAEADLSLLRQQFVDAELKSPTDGVIRNRLMEPGELATPQRPVFSIAITHPKWVRAYLSESDLGRVNVGLPATITIDGSAQRIDGTVSFISSMAEFTPKTVQTEELRTSLVYEVRVLVQDPQDHLRLGMPASVSIDTTAPRQEVPVTNAAD